MTNIIDPNAQAARDSFSGRGLTENQFRDAWAISGIIHVEIQRSGSFVEKLGDYSHAFARSEKFTALRGETIVRDIYGGRYGQSMNQTRKDLIATEEALPPQAKTRALECAETIASLIQAPPTQPFYQAYDRAALTMAQEFGITQTGAKSLVKDAYAGMHGRDLYAAGKEAETLHHKPVRDAEIAARKAEQQPSRSPQYRQG